MTGPASWSPVVVPSRTLPWLAKGIELAEVWARTNGFGCPPELAELRRALAAMGSAPQGLASAAESDDTSDDEPVELLTVDQTARRMGVSADTVRRRIADGSLVATRVGVLLRVHVDDLAAFLRRARNQEITKP